MQRTAASTGIAREFKNIFELGGVPAFNQFYEFGIFIWKMQYGSEEYKMLQEIKKDNPKMKVSVRESNRKATANPYKGLTYRYMRKFISVMDKENLSTFEEVVLMYEGLYTDNATVFAAVRDWFLENYPHHKEMIVAAVPTRKTSLASVPVAEVSGAAA